MNVVDTNREESITLGTSLEGQAFAINSDAAFFDILSNSLYSNPLNAVLRETLTNALDAHQEAGITDPISVVYNAQEGLFTVKDKGYGIPHDQIHAIYCTYGNSTKRNLSSTGGFGLGCKSPFALTNTFSIVNCNNGIKKTYVFDKKNGIPEIIRIQGEESTTEQGLTVIIPIPNQYQIIYPYVQAFAYYTGSKIVFNGTELKHLEYGKDGFYYVKEDAPVYLITLGIRSYVWDKLTLLYGKNLYPVTIDKAKDAGLKQLYDNWAEVVDRIDFIGANLRNPSLRYGANPIVKVPANSLDITPNREDLRYTSKTIATLKEVLQKELNRLKSGINVPVWLDLYRNNRIGALLGCDNVYMQFKEQGYITYKDIISKKRDCNGKSTKLASYVAITKDTQDLFPKEVKDFVSFYLANDAAIHEDYPAFANSVLITKAISAINTLEAPLKQVLKDNKVNTYYYRGISFNTKDPLGLAKFKEIYKDSYYYAEFIFKRAFRVVILSNYKASNKGSPLFNSLADKYPQYSAAYLMDYAYRVVLQNRQRADAIEQTLKAKGYYVINLVQDKETTPRSYGKAQEIVDSLVFKDKAFYSESSAVNKLECYKTYSKLSLYEHFVLKKFPHEATHFLTRLRTYVEVPVTNHSFISVFKKNGLKPMEEVIFEDIKDLLNKSAALKEAVSMIYFSTQLSADTTIVNRLHRIFWFIYQIPDICKRYSLPMLNEDELKQLCFINAFVGIFPEYKTQLEECLTAEGRVSKVLANITELIHFNETYYSVIAYLYQIIVQLQKEGLYSNAKVSALLFSILDSFLITEEKTNE